MTVRLITTIRRRDSRGWFVESYSAARLADAGIHDSFVQDNHSYSCHAGTLRGLHFQSPPFAQAKLVRCLRGRIWDVVVDIRASSPTYGKWVGRELSEENGDCIYVPIGMAHGFVTLTNDCEVEYKVSNRYAAESEGGIVWDDVNLAIAWPISGIPVSLSEKDSQLQAFADFRTPFAYDGQPLSLDGIA